MVDTRQKGCQGETGSPSGIRNKQFGRRPPDGNQDFAESGKLVAAFYVLDELFYVGVKSLSATEGVYVNDDGQKTIPHTICACPAAPGARESSGEDVSHHAQGKSLMPPKGKQG